MTNKGDIHPENTPYLIMASALGDAIFSGLTLEDIFQALYLSNDENEFYHALDARVRMHDIKEDHYNNDNKHDY